MGYETTIIVVEHYGKEKKFVGYHSVVGSMELCKVGSDLQEIEELAKKNRKVTTEDTTCHAEMEAAYKNCFIDGEWTPELKAAGKRAQDSAYAEYSTRHRKLEKKFPFIYWRDGNHESFEDHYGTFLMHISLDEAIQGLRKAEARMVNEEGDGYYAYRMAIKMLEAFKVEMPNARVILWGH